MVEDTLAEHSCEQAVRDDVPLWLASWANPYRCMEWIHRYVFAAPSRAAAQEKIEAWMRKRPCPLPTHARMRPRRLVLRKMPEYPLDFWQITWLEDGEFHTLILFEMGVQRSVCRRAIEWTQTRCEYMGQLQILRQLTDIDCIPAHFDPDEGIEMSKLL